VLFVSEAGIAHKAATKAFQQWPQPFVVPFCQLTACWVLAGGALPAMSLKHALLNPELSCPSIQNLLVNLCNAAGRQ
jgi:hypothetical protein